MMLRLILLFLCSSLIFAANAPSKFPSYDDFLVQFQKVKPNGSDYDTRKANYELSIKVIEENERLFASGTVKYKLELNYYADDNIEEGTPIKTLPSNRSDGNDIPDFNQNVPLEFDWTTVTPKVVNDIRLQYKIVPNGPFTYCGSCWAQSAIAVIESQYAIKYKQLLDLSEQQLVDCSTAYGNGGCNGGWSEDAYRYVADHGISTEAEYPYIAKNGKCLDSKVKPSPVKVTKYILLPQDEEKIKKYLYTFGPLSVSLMATKKLRLYKEGIIDSLDCCDYSNHEVVLVGYGAENGTSFWKARNAWGKFWGEEGYFRIIRGKGACLINQVASMPIFENHDKH